MNNPLVTVIIPTFNRAEILKETIQSVLNQTVKDYEIIIVDDGSKDHTKAAVASFGLNKIEYIYQENKGRPAPGRNTGLKLARGKYIAFLDDDDLWLPDKLSLQLKVLESRPEIVAVSTNGEFYPKPRMGLRPQRFLFRMLRNKRVSFQSLLWGNKIINSSVLMRSEVREAIGYMDESPAMRAIEDYDYWLRILHWKDLSIMVLKKPLVLYRTHRANISRDDLVETESVQMRELRTLAVIFNKYQAGHANLLRAAISERARVNEKYRLKEAFAVDQESFTDLMGNQSIKALDKLEIGMKVQISRLLKKVGK